MDVNPKKSVDYEKEYKADMDKKKTVERKPRFTALGDLVKLFKENINLSDDIDKYSDISSTYISCNQKTVDRNSRIYQRLNEDQKVAYCKIHESLSSSFHFKSSANAEILSITNNVIILIDTESGTGKTFLLSALATTYRQSAKFIVFRKDLASEVSLLDNVCAYTYVSFNMRHFGLPYHSAINTFTKKNLKPIVSLYILIVYAKNYRGDPNDTFIFDTFTIASPLMLLLLYIVALKHHINIIFAGNKIQQGAICSSDLHCKNNYYIVNMISDLTINNLSTNMRSFDGDFAEKLARFREVLRTYKPEGNVKFEFNMRYLLYTLFRTKYFTEENFDNLYVAQFHKDIKERSLNFIEHLKKIRKTYVLEPFSCRKNKFKAFSDVSLSKKGRFYPALILVEGCKYIHVNANGVHQVVQLEKLVFKDVKLDYLIVRLEKENQSIKLTRCVLNYYQILPAYRVWLLGSHEGDIQQFPLRMYTLTYHAALERTIEDVNVEYSTDCTTANCIYVGLCCIRRSSAIHKIHAEKDLLSLIVTDYMENERGDTEYFYRCPFFDEGKDKILKYATERGVNKYIESIKWITVDNKNIFRDSVSNGYLRIKRDKFIQTEKEKEKIEEKVTPLMKIAKFIKSNQNVVNDTIKTINIESNNKTAKKQESDILFNRWEKVYEKRDSFVQLEKAYKSWVADLEKN